MQVDLRTIGLITDLVFENENNLNEFEDHKDHIYRLIFEELKMRMMNMSTLMIKNLNYICSHDQVHNYLIKKELKLSKILLDIRNQLDNFLLIDKSI